MRRRRDAAPRLSWTGPAGPRRRPCNRALTVPAGRSAVRTMLPC